MTLGLNPTIQDLERIKEGRYTVSRVDINRNMVLKNRTEVLAWIQSAGEKMSMPYQGKVFLVVILFIGVKALVFYLKYLLQGDEIHGKSNFQMP